MTDKAKQLADDSKLIAESRKMTDEEFVKSMSNSDSLIDHEPNGTCGMCHHQWLMAEVAREMVKEGNFENAISRWSEETRRRWEDSKFFKLWQEAVADGKEPHAVFEEKGWEP
jgi:hypothetical protein